MAVNFAVSKTLETDDFKRSYTSKHTVFLFDKNPNTTTGGYDTKNFTITKEDFKNLFYKYNTFGFLDDFNTKNILDDKVNLGAWTKSTAANIPIVSAGYNVVNDIISLWEADTGLTKDNWSRSSYMHVVSSLLTLNRWTKLTFTNTLTFTEILNQLNQSELLSGNNLFISILATNKNTNTKPVEIILNFTIA